MPRFTKLEAEARKESVLAMYRSNPALSTKEIAEVLNFSTGCVCRYLKYYRSRESLRLSKQRFKKSTEGKDAKVAGRTQISAVILDVVLTQEVPAVGLTSRQILERLQGASLGGQRLRSHLKRLEKLGLIYSLFDPTHNLRLLYYPGEAGEFQGETVLESKSRIILATIASVSEGLNFRALLARCRVGLSPPEMVSELRSLKEKGLIRIGFDPNHKRRYLYFPVTQDASN